MGLAPFIKTIYLLLTALPTSIRMPAPAPTSVSLLAAVRLVVLISKPTPLERAVALIDMAVPVVRELALICIVVAEVVAESVIRKPEPTPVRLPLKVKLTMPVVEPAVPVVELDTESAAPVVRALALIASALPVVRALALIAIVVARVVDASSIWKPLVAVVLLPVKLKLIIPALVPVLGAVAFDVTYSALPVAFA